MIEWEYPFHPETDIQLTLWHEGDLSSFLLTEDGTLYDAKQRIKIHPCPAAQQELQRLARSLRKKHYGEMLPWSEVKHLFPKKARSQIIDLETGLTFDVERRAGDKHADVQPLTRADTDVMKRIYKGKWIWDRRAILIQVDDRRIAASMHGMPHGRGSLQNGFPGISAFIFFGSTTHLTQNADPSHQLMIHKAAGKRHSILFSHMIFLSSAGA